MFVIVPCRTISARVERIKLVVGKLSMALPDSLQFAFEAIKAGEELFRQADLEIEEKKSYAVVDSATSLLRWKTV